MALPINGSTHLIPAYYSFYRPRKDERLSWPSWLTCSGWLTRISGHPSAAGRAQDRESSPARDRRSTTEPRHQLVPETPEKDRLLTETFAVHLFLDGLERIDPVLFTHTHTSHLTSRIIRAYKLSGSFQHPDSFSRHKN